MDIIPDKRKVIRLVEQAHEGKICLPNFQRDFVWTRDGEEAAIEEEVAADVRDGTEPVWFTMDEPEFEPA